MAIHQSRAAPGVCLSASVAQAGNDDEVLVGPQATLSGGAVTAVVNDGSALWYNPAGLGLQKRNQINVNGTAYTLRLWKIPDYLTGPGGASSDADTSEFVIIPTSVTFVRASESPWALGAGYFQSRYSELRGHASISFPDEDGEAVWQSGYVQTYVVHNFVAGASYDFSSQFSFGGALQGIYLEDDYSTEFSGGAVGDPRGEFIAVSSQGVQAHGGAQLQVGLRWQPDPRVALGLSLRTPALGFYRHFQQYGFTTSSFALGADDGAGQPALINGYDTEKVRKDEWRSEWVLPPRLRLGVARTFDGGYLSFDIDAQTAMQGDTVQIGSTAASSSSGRDAVVNARLGGSLALFENTSVGLGVFTDRGSEREETLGVGVFDFYGVAAGARFGEVHHVVDSEDSRELRFSTVAGVRYAYGVGRATGLSVPLFADLTRGLVDGGEPLKATTVSAKAHEFSVNIGGGVYF